MTVHAQRLADIPDFVCEANFQPVEAVAGVLDHFRYAHGHHMHRRFQSGIQSSHRIRSLHAVGTDQRKGRVEEILDRRPFAQKLRIAADAEVDASLLP